MTAHSLSPISYRSRMDRACEKLFDGALLVMAPALSIRNSNQEYSFRQDSFFHYLTGFEEPSCALLILSQKPVGERYILFVREKNELEELWEGKRLGVSEAPNALQVDKAFPIGALWDKLPELLDGASRLYCSMGRHEESDRHLIRALQKNKKRRGRTTTTVLPLFDSDIIAGQLRLRKGPEEVERMKRAAAITKHTFDKILKEVRPGMNEQQVWAWIMGEFMFQGAEMEAYTSIVAGGSNACCLHYRSNNAPLNDNELLLIDAGSQFQYYASDVTRTFPIGKKFTPEQKAVYEVVLESQLKAIELAKPGSTLTAIYDKASDVLADGMIQMGFFKQSKQEVMEKGLFKKYFPHNTSHWIGMDVHDVGDYHLDGKPRPLEPGMYFSVEPGIYIDPSDTTQPEGFRGIGIRIEDDVLITVQGHEIITAGIPKTVAELENRY